MGIKSKSTAGETLPSIGALFSVALVVSALTAAAEISQPISQRHPALSAPDSAEGDSINPILSADGVYVLFASSADNLVLGPSGTGLGGPAPAKMNVYLRNRTNNTTTLVSINVAGTTGGNGDSDPIDISSDNRYVLFESFASDLINNDTNKTGDVFVRDLTLGTTLLASANTNGGVGNGVSRRATMSPDGRYVAFASAAPDLVLGDTNGIPDIFVRDLQSGATAWASPGAKALSPAGASDSPLITPDGRFVAFYSTATNLTAGAGNNVPGDVYLKDLLTGQTFLASTNARAIATPILGTSTPEACYSHVLSDDGQYVAYAISKISTPPSRALVLRYNRLTGLTDTVSTNGMGIASFETSRVLDMSPDGRFVAFIATSGTNVYLWDGQSGNTTLVSANLSSGAPVGAVCQWPILDASGRYVAFFSSATNLTPNTVTGFFNLYVRDTVANSTKLVNADAGGSGTVLSPLTYPSFSANARWLAFESPDGSLALNDSNRCYDVFVRDLVAGTNQLISPHHPSLPSFTANAPSTISLLSLSSNGQFLAFSSRADNLVTNDTNGVRDVFFRDLTLGTNLLVSINSTGTSSGNGMSYEPALSANGRYVAFTSRAGNLVPGDSTNFSDVFLRDTQAGGTTLVSVNTNGTGPGNESSSAPMLGADGRFVLFHSRAQNLSSSFPGALADNVFLRDLQAGTTRALTTNGASGGSVGSMTPNGRYIIYTLPGVSPGLFVYDTQLAQRIYTNSVVGATNVGISPNGNRIVYATASQLSVADLSAHTNGVIGAALGTTRPGLRFSADGRYLVYATTSAVLAGDTNQAADIYLYDFQTSTRSLISKSFGTSSAASGASDSPDISADARYIAYRSFAANIVPGDDNAAPDIFLYDRLSNVTRLVTVSSTGTAFANGRSFAPVFSADARSLAFESWAANLSTLDHNQHADLFLAGLLSPPITDSDADGLDDTWEMQNFGTLDRDGTGDFDGDGATDLAEFLSGTDPADPASYLHLELLSLGTATQGPTLSWPAAFNQNYQVQYTSSLDNPTWLNLNPTVAYVGAKAYGIDPNPINGQRFYRILMGN